MINLNEIKDKIKNDEIFKLIKMYSADAEIYVVGGIIRDFYLDKENFDKDIIVQNIDAGIFAKSLAKVLDATFIPLDEENKIYRLVLKDKINCIDVASLIGNNIEEDLRRRDLTINAIAVNLKTLELLDITGGLDDLKSKIIRHISEQNFIDDPLRLLRVFRFQANLGFELDPELITIIKKHAAEIKKPAVERVNYELMKLFSGEFSEQALLKMDEADLLGELFPITQKLKEVPPNLHHHLDLFSHSLEIIRQIQYLYEKSSAEVQKHLMQVNLGGATRLAHLKLSGLLHDIGKPSTWTIEEGSGKHRFIKHDDVGSKMCAKLLKTAKFSKKQIEYVVKMVKFHIYPSHVVGSPGITEKIYMRFIRKMDNDVIDIITLAMADRLSARGVEITDEIVEKNINNLMALLEYYLKIKDDLKPLPKLISGEEIMEALNIAPSKELGEIIKAIKDSQLAGEITTKEEALAFVKSKAQ